LATVVGSGTVAVNVEFSASARSDRSPFTLARQSGKHQKRSNEMTTLETLAVVFAVYGVLFLAHRATQVIDRA
jgi:hypothetical protein